MKEESNDVEPEVVDEIPAYYDALTGLLNQVQLNEQTKEVILRNYRERPQEFEQSAWRMLNYITALGVRENVARYLTSRFWSITKNMDLDLFQGMLNPQQSSPFGVGGIAYPPQAGTPASQYPIPPPQPEDADSKMMRMMMMMKMMNQPTSSSQDPMQQMMQMLMMSGGRMGFTQTPAFQANGQPLLDGTGNQVMSFTMNPAMQQQSVPQGQESFLEIFKEVIKGQNEQKRSADDRYYRSLEKQREIESEIADKESLALRRRLAMVEQERSSDRLIEDVEKLRKLGLFATGSGGGPANTEAIKLQTDLEKWKFERETDLSRWQQQTDMEARKWYKERELEEVRENRTQERLGILGETVSDTLKSVAGPILESMSSGIASNLRPQVAPAGEAPDLSQISDQALVDQFQEVERIDARTDEAKAYLKAEMERRMAAQGVAPPTAAPEQAAPSGFYPPVAPAPAESQFDLGGLDLQFGASPAPTITEDYPKTDDYEHSEELVDAIGETSVDDYDAEY